MVTWGSSILRNLHVLPLDTHNWTDMLSNIECQRSSPGPSGHCTLKWKSSLVHSTIDLGPAKSWNMYDIAWVRVQLEQSMDCYGFQWILQIHDIKSSSRRWEHIPLSQKIQPSWGFKRLALFLNISRKKICSHFDHHPE